MTNANNNNKKITEKYVICIRLLKAIANEDEMIQNEALYFESDVQTVKVCLDGAETTIGKC